MKKELTLRINKEFFEFLEAYGNLFGCDAGWAAMSIMRESIEKNISNEFLSKAHREMSLAKRINTLKGSDS